VQAYVYDAAGRLTAVRDTVDGPAGATCTIRAYEFHDATNRTAVHTAGADGDTCPAPPSSATRAWTSDAADRHTDTGYAADAFGRFTTVPAVDTPTGKALTIGYHANDLVRSLSDGARTTTYTLDVDQTRIGSWTDAGDASTITRVHHYDGGGDAPAWTEENTTGPEAERYYTRNVGGIGGDLSVIHDSATGSTFQVANPHGDVVGTSGADGTLTSANGTADEYGTPRDTATTGSAATAGSAPSNAPPTPPAGSPSWASGSTTPPPAGSCPSTPSPAATPTPTSTAAATPSTAMTSTAGGRGGRPAREPCVGAKGWALAAVPAWESSPAAALRSASTTTTD
jgi:hypothetical protein